MKLYNTLTREKEDFKPLHKDWVGLYTCGPTVYNYAHIGNLRTYIFEDVLQRTLEYNGYTVKRVMNITDVGHLTGDVDTGEDKLDKTAQAQNKSVEEIARYYTDVFFEDLAKLNIKKPEYTEAATKFIPDQINIIKILFEKGYAYDTPNAVYFDVSKFKNYGKLSGQSLAEKSVGAREGVVIDSEKRNAADFVLWFKLVGKFEHHLLHWASPWGEGFPGWHIECSAISRHFLGQPFDVHTGGVDHIGTHHTNEIAQSEAAFGVPLANIWMHGEFLLINEGRMGKSQGNFITLKDLITKGYDPIIYRYFTLGAHYRTQLNFTWEALDAAKNGLEKIYQGVYNLAETADESTRITTNPPSSDHESILDDLEKIFKITALNDDLNMPKAVVVFRDTIFGDYGNPVRRLEMIKKFDNVLGLNIERAITAYSPKERTEIAGKLEKLKPEYDKLRASKQFIQSDALRKEIEGLGYSVRDTENGSYIVKKFF